MLYSGKICWDEVNRVKRLARKDCLRLPHFIRDLENYKRKLRQIGVANGLIPKTEKRVQSPTKSPVPDRRTQIASPFRRRKLIENGFVGSPCPPPFLPYGTSPRQRKCFRNSPAEFDEIKPVKVCSKVSAEVIFVDEKPSTSTLHDDQNDSDFNNHCSHIENRDYEYDPDEKVQWFARPEHNRINSSIPRSDLYLFTPISGGNAEENVIEETLVLPQEKYNHVPNFVSQKGVAQYSYEILRTHFR